MLVEYGCEGRHVSAAYVAATPGIIWLNNQFPARVQLIIFAGLEATHYHHGNEFLTNRENRLVAHRGLRLAAVFGYPLLKIRGAGCHSK